MERFAKTKGSLFVSLSITLPTISPVITSYSIHYTKLYDIKGTTIESTSDITGLFLIENLSDGDYTLVCNFVGYETKEINVHVSALEPTEVNISLEPSTISFNELAAINNNVTKKEDKTSLAINN